MPFIPIIAQFFGISTFRLVAYAVAVFLVLAGALTGWLTVRHHYVSLGYSKALKDVKKQDANAKAAAEKVEKKTAVCTDKNGYWDVITQACKLDDPS